MAHKRLPLELSPTVEGAVDFLLSESRDQTVVVGPLVWQPSDGTAAKEWYFITATGGRRGWLCHRTNTDDAGRTAIILELCRRRGVVINVCDDELQAARLCEALWPGRRITRIRKQIERDRR
jgi:hypothetical protein